MNVDAFVDIRGREDSESWQRKVHFFGLPGTTLDISSFGASNPRPKDPFFRWLLTIWASAIPSFLHKTSVVLLLRRQCGFGERVWRLVPVQRVL